MEAINIMLAMTTEQMKTAACAEIERRGDEAVRLARTVLDSPEPGFREQKTAKVVADALRGLDVPIEEGIALTGMKGMLRGGSSGPPGNSAACGPGSCRAFCGRPTSSVPPPPG